MTKNALNVEQKKGDPALLDGQVTVYAKIDIDPVEFMTVKHPVASLIHGGLLAVQGNYREQSSLRDFLRSEMGITIGGGNNASDDPLASLTDGVNDGAPDAPDAPDDLKEMIDNMGGIESALDPKKLRERLENMSDIEDFIPTPAKVVPFHTEVEILAQPGDIYFAGLYKGIANAVLGVNAVPIIYQALFREQQARSLHCEIESLISQIEGSEPTDLSICDGVENPEEALLKTYIPSMLYNKTNPTALTNAKKQFRSFMRGYRFNDDVEAITSMIDESRNLGANDYKLLELYAKKIAMVQAEEFAGVTGVCKDIDRIVSGG